MALFSLKLVQAQQQLAPLGVLRVAVNLSNPLLIQQDTITNNNDSGGLRGIAPSFAAAIANKLQVPCTLIRYDHPDQICTALAETQRRYGSDTDVYPWDIALIGADPARTQHIQFTPPYCEIQATCMVPAQSSIRSFDDVNQSNITVCVKGGGAYDLWLTRNWSKPNYLRTTTLEESYTTYINNYTNNNNGNNNNSNNNNNNSCTSPTIDVLAGLRPRLLEDLERANTAKPASQQQQQHRLLDGSFMAVQQAIGCIKYNKDNTLLVSPGELFLSDFVDEARQPGGLVDTIIKEHGQTGRLSLPTITTTTIT